MPGDIPTLLSIFPNPIPRTLKMPAQLEEMFTADGLRPIPILLGMFRKTAVALVMLGRISWNALPLYLVD
ncbi:hypothetical protein MCEMAEM21_02116 [Oxalobacteraceae bacterium]|jgi:hypothetical protein